MPIVHMNKYQVFTTVHNPKIVYATDKQSARLEGARLFDVKPTLVCVELVED
jgi:hypothetical protein